MRKNSFWLPWAFMFSTAKRLFQMLDNDLHDFGKDIIPGALKDYRVCSYVYQGAWEDIGTIRAYFDCSIDLTSGNPKFTFFDMNAPVFTRARFLPLRGSMRARLNNR